MFRILLISISVCFILAGSSVSHNFDKPHEHGHGTWEGENGEKGEYFVLQEDLDDGDPHIQLIEGPAENSTEEIEQDFQESTPKETPEAEIPEHSGEKSQDCGYPYKIEIKQVVEKFQPQRLIVTLLNKEGNLVDFNACYKIKINHTDGSSSEVSLDGKSITYPKSEQEQLAGTDFALTNQRFFPDIPDIPDENKIQLHYFKDGESRYSAEDRVQLIFGDRIIDEYSQEDKLVTGDLEPHTPSQNGSDQSSKTDINRFSHIIITHIEVYEDPYFLKVYVKNSSNPLLGIRSQSVDGMSFVIEYENGELKHKIGLPYDNSFTHQTVPTKGFPEFTSESGIRANNAFIIGSRRYMKDHGESEQDIRFKLQWRPYYERKHGRYDPDRDVIKILKGDIEVAIYPEPEPPAAPPITRKRKMTTLWGKIKQD